MRIQVFINELSKEPQPDELDVITQTEAVEEGLQQLGYKARRNNFSIDLHKNLKAIEDYSPDVIFNLVEAVGHKADLIHLAPVLFESTGIPFTGSGTYAFYLTSKKSLAKERFRELGIPTADWFTQGMKERPSPEGKYILKPLWEDGSVGINDGSVVRAADPAAEAFFTDPRYLHWMLEEYIHGREFNLSLLAGPDGPEVLPPAEIRYLNYPEGKPRILGYASKWDESSFEYINTPRSFEMSAEDAPLLDRLKKISLECWHALKLGGYGRVDFRVDENNRPFVLEVNTNPCISPDAGFMAACRQSGMDYPQVLDRLIQDAINE